MKIQTMKFVLLFALVLRTLITNASTLCKIEDDYSSLITKIMERKGVAICTVNFLSNSDLLNLRLACNPFWRETIFQSLWKERLDYFYTLLTFSYGPNVPLLKNDINGNWLLANYAKYLLNHPHIANRNFHVISVGGRTRVGKSFLMKNIVEMIKNSPNGQSHFGSFLDLNGMDSCTRGMDIALVEYYGNLLLLIDCEALARKNMNPKLMVIMSMISQEMIYLDVSMNIDTLDNVNQMLIKRNNALDASGVPLNTLYFVSNKCELERNDNLLRIFLNEQLTKPEHATTKALLDDAFQERLLFFVGRGKRGRVTAQVKADIEHILNNITTNINDHFALNSNKLTLGRFVKYLESVLTQVNGNKKFFSRSRITIFGLESSRGKLFNGKDGIVLNGPINKSGRYRVQVENDENTYSIHPENMILLNERITFPDVLQATYEQFAQNKIDELKCFDMEDCKRYHNEGELLVRLMKIEKKKEEFADEVKDYKDSIPDMVEKFLRELEEFQRRFEIDNEKFLC